MNKILKIAKKLIIDFLNLNSIRVISGFILSYILNNLAYSGQVKRSTGIFYILFKKHKKTPGLRPEYA